MNSIIIIMVALMLVGTSEPVTHRQVLNNTDTYSKPQEALQSPIKVKGVSKYPVAPRVRIMDTPDCQKWDKVIEKHSKNKSEEVWAKRVMRCESRCNPSAVNQSSGASGLFQYITKWHPSMKGKVFDGEESIKYALYKYRQGGAGLWVCK